MAPAKGSRRGGEAASVEIPADLLPSEAGAVHGALIDRLRGHGPCAIELSGAPASASALQLLVASERMARRDGLDVRLGALARAALARLGTSETTGD